MSNLLQNTDASEVIVRDSKSSSSVSDISQTDNTKEYKITRIERPDVGFRHYQFLSIEHYRKVLAKEEGTGVVEIILGVTEIIFGVLAVVVGILLLQPWLAAGGIWSIGAGSLAIASGVTRSTNPEMSRFLGYTAIAVGTVGMLMSLYGGYRAGLIASRSIGGRRNLVRGAIYNNQTQALHETLRYESAVNFSSVYAERANRWLGAPGTLGLLAARALSHQTAHSARIAPVIALGVGVTFGFGYAGHWHSFNKQAEKRFDANQARRYGGSEIPKI